MDVNFIRVEKYVGGVKKDGPDKWKVESFKGEKIRGA